MTRTVALLGATGYTGRLTAAELERRGIPHRVGGRSKERLADVPGVTVERRRAPDELPDGPFDLIVCSEVLYYWDRALLRLGVARLLERLAPSGSFLAVHWRGPVRHYPQGGDAVHEALREELAGLQHVRERMEPRYRLDRWDAPC